MYSTHVVLDKYHRVKKQFIPHDFIKQFNAYCVMKRRVGSLDLGLIYS